MPATCVTAVRLAVDDNWDGDIALGKESCTINDFLAAEWRATSWGTMVRLAVNGHWNGDIALGNDMSAINEFLAAEWRTASWGTMMRLSVNGNWDGNIALGRGESSDFSNFFLFLARSQTMTTTTRWLGRRMRMTARNDTGSSDLRKLFITMATGTRMLVLTFLEGAGVKLLTTERRATGWGAMVWLSIDHDGCEGGEGEGEEDGGGEG